MKSKLRKAIKLLLDHRTLCNVTVKVMTLPQNKLLSGRCALITGGTSGIGYSIAEAYINAGASVIITGRSLTKLNNTVSKLQQKSTSSNRVYGFVLNNTQPSTFDLIFNKMLEAVDKDGISMIDILVNNAGINCKGMPNATEEEYDSVMDTNLKGTFFLCQLVGRYMKIKGIHGNILNIASASSLRPADSAYILSKWGLRSLTLGLAKSLGKDGITVNGIAPGPTATPMMINKGNTNMALDRLLLGRYIMPEEIANMAVILVSDMGRSIMGDTIYMTGGAGNLTYDDVKYSF